MVPEQYSSIIFAAGMSSHLNPSSRLRNLPVCRLESPHIERHTASAAASSASAQEIQNHIRNAHAQTPSACRRAGGLIRVLLVLIPAAAVLQARNQVLIIAVAGFHGGRRLGVLKGNYVISETGIRDGAVIVPLRRFISDAVQYIEGFAVMPAVKIICRRLHAYAVFIVGLRMRLGVLVKSSEAEAAEEVSEIPPEIPVSAVTAGGRAVISAGGTVRGTAGGTIGASGTISGGP